MRRYPKYKDSGVEWIGEIPEGWILSKFKFDTTTPVQYGLNISSDKYKDKGIRFIRITDLTEEGLLIKENGKYLEKNEVPDEFLLKKYDLLFCRSGHTVGKSYLHLEDGEYTSGGYLVRFNFSSFSSSKFVFYLTKTNFYWDWIKLNTVVSTIENVNGDKYQNFIYPKPTLQEQQQIVTYLDHKTSLIDQIISNSEKKIELLKEQRISTINHSVTKGLNPKVKMKGSGVEWIGEIPEGWNLISLKHLVSSKITDGPHETPIFIEDGIPFLSAESVQDNKLDFNKKRACISIESHQEYSKKCKPQINDILIVKSGSTTGKSTIVETDIEFNIWSPLCIVRSKKELISPRFTFSSIQSNYFRRFVELGWSFGTQPNIGMGVIENIKLVVPPLQEQEQIVTYLDQKTKEIDDLISSEQKRIQLIKEYRQSLISEVVTGKTKVTK